MFVPACVCQVSVWEIQVEKLGCDKPSLMMLAFIITLEKNYIVIAFGTLSSSICAIVKFCLIDDCFHNL